MGRVVHAQTILHAEKRVGRLRAEDGLPHCGGQRDGIADAFERDEWARRGKSQEPVLVERQLLALSPELVQMGGKPVRVLLLHDVQRLASARTGKTVSADAPAARNDRSAHQAIVESRRDHGRLAVAGRACDDQLVLVDGGIRFQIIGNTRCAPCPARQDAPVISRIGGEKARGAERPAAILITQRCVLRAVVGIEDDQRIPAAKDVAALCGHRLRGGLGPARGHG